MDYLLPDEDTLKIMAAEYEKLKRSGCSTSTLCSSQELNSIKEDVASLGVHTIPDTLVLYFALILGYNLGYGVAISNADRGMGGVQSREGSDRDLNNFFFRKR